MPKKMMLLLLIMFMAITACGQPAGQAPEGESQDRLPNANFTPLQIDPTNPSANTENDQQSLNVIPLLQHEEGKYIPLQQLVHALEYTMEWDAEQKSYQIGDNDVAYEIFINSPHIKNEEEDINLQHSSIMIDGQPYIPEEAFHQLFQDDMNYELRGQQIFIYPAAQEVDRSEVYQETDDAADESLNFSDDPTESITMEEEEVWLQQDPALLLDEADYTAVLKKVNRNNLISTARKYLGVKYKFGAAHYSKSKRFDCSSYTQYAFNKHGVKLRRLSRNQAKQGIAVSRKNLRKGDLLFFYIPGRFKSNKVVGHVGIYMGNNRMIHAGTEPKNGVQITNINTNYWKKTFLRARRVIKS